MEKHDLIQAIHQSLGSITLSTPELRKVLRRQKLGFFDKRTLNQTLHQLKKEGKLNCESKDNYHFWSNKAAPEQPILIVEEESSASVADSSSTWKNFSTFYEPHSPF